jgi:protein-tyrosine phosphatase
MFVCHGNICRSPMAEFVLKDMVKKRGLEARFIIASSATSTEEIGNPVHYGTVNKLAEHNISTKGKYSAQLTKADYPNYDYFIGMDSKNLTNMERLFHPDPENKIYKLLGFAKRKSDIADPWYTGDFDTTYEDIVDGCTAFLKQLEEKKLI